MSNQLRWPTYYGLAHDLSVSLMSFVTRLGLVESTRFYLDPWESYNGLPRILMFALVLEYNNRPSWIAHKFTFASFLIVWHSIVLAEFFFQTNSTMRINLKMFKPQPDAVTTENLKFRVGTAQDERPFHLITEPDISFDVLMFHSLLQGGCRASRACCCLGARHCCPSFCYHGRLGRSKSLPHECGGGLSLSWKC